MVYAEIGIGDQNDDLMEPPAQGYNMTGTVHVGVGNGESVKLSSKDKKSQVHEEIWAKIFDKLITEDSRGLLRDFLGKHANTHYRPRSKSNNSLLGAPKLSYRGKKYLLKDGVGSVNLGNFQPGLSEPMMGWDYGLDPPSQFADGVINLNLDAEERPVLLTDEEVTDHIIGLIMAQQYSLKKGMELFDDRAGKATLKEMQQLHDLDTYTPLDPNMLSISQYV